MNYLVYTAHFGGVWIDDDEWLVMAFKADYAYAYEVGCILATFKDEWGVSVLFVGVNFFDEANLNITCIIVDSGNCLWNL